MTAIFNKKHHVLYALIATYFVILVAFVLFGNLVPSYQGDEGFRLYDIYQTGLSYPGRLYGDTWNFFTSQLFGFHPPLDVAIRSLLASSLNYFGLSTSPYNEMLLLSIILGTATQIICCYLVYRSSGLYASIICFCLMISSVVIMDMRMSTMAESTAVILLISSLFFLYRHSINNSFTYFILGSLAFLAGAMTRPEVVFVLPGLCLLLLVRFGFVKACLFGLIASSLDIIKVLSSVFSPSGNTNLLNVGDLYFNKAHSFSSFINSQFFEYWMSDPIYMNSVLGMVLSIVFIFLVVANKIKSNLIFELLFYSGISYLIVVVLSQFFGLAPHASYRLNITFFHLILPAYVIAGFSVIEYSFSVYLKKKLVGSALSSLRGALFGGAFALLTFIFFTNLVNYIPNRVPVEIRATWDFLESRLGTGDSIYVDRMRYWEASFGGLQASFSQPTCSYARCAIADPWVAEKHLNVPGNVFKGDQNGPSRKILQEVTRTIRQHTFISNAKPRYILVANEKYAKEWFRVASGLWPDEEERKLNYSHIFPYLIEPIDWGKPQPVFLKLGTVMGTEYFDDYVYLVPRYRNELNIVYQAYYGRRPDPSLLLSKEKR